jgi:hypothetical protein
MRTPLIMGMVRDAAVTDADMAAQWATNEQQWPSAFRTLAQLLANRDALKPGLSVVEAADVIFGLLSPSCTWCSPPDEAGQPSDGKFGPVNRLPAQLGSDVCPPRPTR